MSTVLIVAHHERPEALQLASQAAEWLQANGHEACIDPSDGGAIGLDHLVDHAGARRADLCVALGGDGTILRAVQLIAEHQVPLIGVNLGWLGYLTEIEPVALVSALERWMHGPTRGGWQIEERMMLSIEVDPGGADQRWLALNEAVVERRDAGHTIRMQVAIAGAPFTSYSADGMIVATPTGSTAYSLSARGPVVSPRHKALLLTPVSPHMLFDRSLVLTADENVDIEVVGHRPAVLTIDGQAALNLEVGDTVRVSMAEVVARFVRFSERRFHQILKAKFELPDR